MMTSTAIEAACGAALDAIATRAVMENEEPAATVEVQPADAGRRKDIDDANKGPRRRSR